MLTISGVSKGYGGRTLFRDATLQVNRGDRIGLVGPNGAGKSTLFSLILGEESADEGNIVIRTRHHGRFSAAGKRARRRRNRARTRHGGFRRNRAASSESLKAWEADHPVEALHPEEIHDDVHDVSTNSAAIKSKPKPKRFWPASAFAKKISIVPRAK